MKYKEKLKNIFQGKRKTENLVILLVLIVIVVVAINYIWNDKNSQNDNTKYNNENNNLKNVVQVSNNASEDELELKLEKILSRISGVGSVKVMITYSESNTFIPVYDENVKISNTTENDNSGGIRTIEETDNQKQVIYKENNDGSKEPVTKSILNPKIEGAIITAIGANNIDIKTKIIQAVEAATGLATHKIQVFEMNTENL